MTLDKSFSIFSLGDSAMTLELGHLIDQQLNRRALLLEIWLREHAFAGVQDIIVAYSSVTVFYDPMEVETSQSMYPDGTYIMVRRWLEEGWMATEGMEFMDTGGEEREVKRLPVCYGGVFGPDMEEMSRTLGMGQKDIIEIHTSVVYRVYMIGFLPGFPYLGKVDPRLETGRKSKPAPVVAGGVGIAGNQTGIYPVNSPGGWQIIGRTPVRLFDAEVTPPVKLTTGDRVQFYPVSMEEYQHLCPR